MFRPGLRVLMVSGLLATATWLGVVAAGKVGGPGPWAIIALVVLTVGIGWGRLPRIPRRDPLKLSLGRTAAFPSSQVVLSGEDRFLHLHVLGPTGAGKSTAVLLPLILQDLDRTENGLTIFDPKGDLVQGVAEACRKRGRSFIRFNPADPKCPPCNLLAGPGGRVAEAAAYAFDKAFGGDNSYYRNVGQNLLRYSLLATKEAMNDTVRLSHLLDLWNNENFRGKILTSTTDRMVRAYFRDQFLQWSPRQRAENTAGLVNQIASLLANPGVRRALEDDAAFSLPQIMGEGRVLLVELPVGELGGGVSLLGTLLLSAFQQAAFARGGTPGKPHFLYLDEFHLFATAGFAEFLAMARSYRVGAVIAHQNFGQLPLSLKEAVLANARSRIAMGGLSPEDAVQVAEGAGTTTRRGRRTYRIDPTFIREMPRGYVLFQLVGRGSILGKVKPARA